MGQSMERHIPQSVQIGTERLKEWHGNPLHSPGICVNYDRFPLKMPRQMEDLFS